MGPKPVNVEKVLFKLPGIVSSVPGHAAGGHLAFVCVIYNVHMKHHK